MPDYKRIPADRLHVEDYQKDKEHWSDRVLE
jgi:hypothetical protein